MARKGRTDRGLLQRQDVQGKLVWHVRLYHHGQERRFGPFPTKTQAREFYEKAKREQKEEKFQPERYQKGGITLTELIDQHLAVTTVKNHATEIYYGKWWKEQLKGVRLVGLTPHMLEKIQAKLVGQNYRPQTVLHYMKFLRHVLNKAVRNGSMTVNPFTKISLVKVPKGRTRFLTSTEETTLLDKLGPIYGPWARLAILTGMRLSEQFGLKWPWVDFDQGVITLPHTKAGGVQYVHLNAEAQTILRTIQIQQMNQGVCTAWVFPSAVLTTHLDRNNFCARVFIPAVKAANLEAVTWHTLRHTFASRLAMTKYSESTIASLLRHSTTALVKRYAHLSQDHLKAAVEDVSEFGQAVNKTPIQNGTVTKTGNAQAVVKEEGTKVIDFIGAGDGS